MAVLCYDSQIWWVHANRDMSLTHKKQSIGYNTTQYVAHLEVSVHQDDRMPSPSPFVGRLPSHLLATRPTSQSITHTTLL